MVHFRESVISRGFKKLIALQDSSGRKTAGKVKEDWIVKSFWHTLL